MKNNVLLIGKGYVGSKLNCVLNALNIDNTVINAATVNYHDVFELERYISSNKFNYVVNCAGFTGRPNVDQAEVEKELCWKLNVLVATNINKLCQRLQLPLIHISSGCIYTGYKKEWSELDPPNFGMYHDTSSFYSKSKHAYELNCNYGLTIRVRMPFDGVKSERSYLSKILKYDNLVNFRNSKTYLPDLCNFIAHYIQYCDYTIDVLNFVNPEPLDTMEVIDIMKFMGHENRKWKFVEPYQLNTKANRSNCILDITKLTTQYNFIPKTETEAVRYAILTDI